MLSIRNCHVSYKEHMSFGCFFFSFYAFLIAFLFSERPLFCLINEDRKIIAYFMKNHIQYLLRFHVMHFCYIEAAKKVHSESFLLLRLYINDFLSLLFTHVFSASSTVFYIFWKSTNHITTTTAAVRNVFFGRSLENETIVRRKIINRARKRSTLVKFPCLREQAPQIRSGYHWHLLCSRRTFAVTNLFSQAALSHKEFMLSWKVTKGVYLYRLGFFQ